MEALNHTIAELLDEHVSLSVECVDRIYLNAYVGELQTIGGMAQFFRQCRNKFIVSPVLLRDMTREFCSSVESFCKEHDIPIVRFERKQRKDDVAARMRRKNPTKDGIYFVGIAQEKQQAFKGTTRNEGKGVSFEYSRQPVCVNQYYFYFVDKEFGPGFIKIGSYFPFPVRICLNGHEWAKCQLEARRVAYQSLDNGFYSCADASCLQRVCSSLSADDIQKCFDRWVDRIPWPLTADDRKAGYQHALSIWQIEVSRTDVFTRPTRGREFFEGVIRENLDLGRPERVQLIFDRRVQSNTPGQFRTRVITHGVAPSLHVEYKHTGIKQYFKENFSGSAPTPTNLRTGCFLNSTASNTRSKTGSGSVTSTAN